MCFVDECSSFNNRKTGSALLFTPPLFVRINTMLDSSIRSIVYKCSYVSLLLQWFTVLLQIGLKI